MTESHEKLIEEIEKACSIHFLESKFKFSKSSFFKFILKGDYLTYAVNHIRNSKSQVCVLHWFEDFWIYIDVSLIKKKEDFTETSISISIFQGDANDSIKTQLFRAEWDNYENNKVHPQPHWHIYPFKYDIKTYEDFEAYNNLIEESNKEGFESSIKNNKTNNIIDVRDFHFAMNGQWAENKNHIHKITNDSNIISWISGVLGHIKEQLTFVK